jgi:probable phosphoglycerate mutase
MKIVYLVRHGESETNAGTVYKGPDSSLTERGRVQAETIAERAANLEFGVIMSSTMNRARQTAAIIAKKVRVPVEYSDLLRERRSPSSHVGMEKSDPKGVRYDTEFFDRLHDPDWRFEDAENFSDLNSRAAEALQYLVDRPEERILVATHGLFMRVLAARAVFGDALTGETCERFVRTFMTENCGLSVLRYGRKPERAPWELLTWNDYAHLG